MTEIQQLLQQGIDAAKAGDKENARQLLGQVVTRDQRNEKAWLWLSDVVQTDEQRRLCLENVLAINPKNTLAKAGLKRLGVERIKPLPPTSVGTKPSSPVDQAAPAQQVAHPKPSKFKLFDRVIIMASIIGVLGLILIGIIGARGIVEHLPAFAPARSHNVTPTPSNVAWINCPDCTAPLWEYPASNRGRVPEQLRHGTQVEIISLETSPEEDRDYYHVKCGESTGYVDVDLISESPPSLTSTPTSTATKTPKPTATPRPKKTPTPILRWDDYPFVDPRELSKNPNKYIGSHFWIWGEVFAIEEEHGETYFQMWARDGTWDQLWVDIAVYFRGELPNVYRDTKVKVYGIGLGSIEGTNAFGATIIMPLVEAEMVWPSDGYQYRAR